MWPQFIIYLIVPPRGEREGKVECLFDLRFFFLWGSGVPWTSCLAQSLGLGWMTSYQRTSQILYSCFPNEARNALDATCFL